MSVKIVEKGLYLLLVSRSSTQSVAFKVSLNGVCAAEKTAKLLVKSQLLQCVLLAVNSSEMRLEETAIIQLIVLSALKNYKPKLKYKYLSQFNFIFQKM